MRGVRDEVGARRAAAVAAEVERVEAAFAAAAARELEHTPTPDEQADEEARLVDEEGRRACRARGRKKKGGGGRR